MTATIAGLTPVELATRVREGGVRDLQRWLRAAGHDLAVDGVYGPVTTRAVQTHAGLQEALLAVGVGPQTPGPLAARKSGGRPVARQHQGRLQADGSVVHDPVVPGSSRDLRRDAEEARRLFDVRITSGARTAAGNATAGGASRSLHLHGHAVDFSVPRDVARFTRWWTERGYRVIDERRRRKPGGGYYPPHIHVDKGANQVPSVPSLAVWRASDAVKDAADRVLAAATPSARAASAPSLDRVFEQAIARWADGPLSARDLRRFASIESSLNPAAVRRNTYYGLFQMGRPAWEDARKVDPGLPGFSVANALDPAINARAFVAYARVNEGRIRRMLLPKVVTADMLYAAHVSLGGLRHVARHGRSAADVLNGRAHPHFDHQSAAARRVVASAVRDLQQAVA